jgi:hypothetical protein
MMLSTWHAAHGCRSRVVRAPHGCSASVLLRPAGTPEMSRRQARQMGVVSTRRRLAQSTAPNAVHCALFNGQSGGERVWTGTGCVPQVRSGFRRVV